MVSGGLCSCVVVICVFAVVCLFLMTKRVNLQEFYKSTTKSKSSTKSSGVKKSSSSSSGSSGFVAGAVTGAVVGTTVANASQQNTSGNTPDSSQPTPEGSGCFAGSSLLDTPNGKKRASEVNVGDQILVFDKTEQVFVFEEVLWIPHEPNTVKAEFVEMVTSSGKTLTLTADHLILVGEDRLLAAEHVAVGDVVRVSSGEWESVVSIKRVVSHGLYTWITRSPYIVVNDVVCCSYAVGSFIPKYILGTLGVQNFHDLVLKYFITSPAYVQRLTVSVNHALTATV